MELHVLFIAIKHGLKAEQRTKHDTFRLLVCFFFSHGFMLNKQVPACDHCNIKDSRMPTEWALFLILVYWYDQFQYDRTNHDSECLQSEHYFLYWYNDMINFSTTAQITIHRISTINTNWVIHFSVVYPMHSTIYPSRKRAWLTKIPLQGKSPKKARVFRLLEDEV